MERPTLIAPSALGEKFVKWALEQETPPGGIDTIVADRPIADLKAEIGDSYGIPDHITHFTIIQHSENHLVLKVPPKAMVQQTEDEFSSPSSGSEQYPLPSFYELKVKHDDPPRNRDFFRFRIADYMTGLCH